MRTPTALEPFVLGHTNRANVRLRRTMDSLDGARTVPSGSPMQVFGVVTGPRWDLGGGITGTRWAWVGRYGETWFVAEPLVTVSVAEAGKVLIPPPSDGKAEAKLAEVSKAVGTLAASNRAEKVAIDALITVVTTP